MKTMVRQESYAFWPAARLRLRQVREAGFAVQATDQGNEIVLYISPGRKHADFRALPPKEGGQL